ncbi:MAG: glycosyltransferase [Parachlamydiaceae bacterium]
MNFLISDFMVRVPEDEESFPFVTILIPTFNCSQILPYTLDSIIAQDYPCYEILIIDGGSTDRTLEILHGYHPSIRLCSALTYNVYAILNQGIALAKGQYINMLFPGDAYIFSRTLEQMMSLALQERLPDLVYCATLLHDGRSEGKFLFRYLSFSLLKRGQQPTCLQACWFRKNVFDVLGDFRLDFEMRGGFDFFCRFCLSRSLRFIAHKRAYVDFDLRGVTSSMVIRHFWETAQTIYTYFGKWALLKWLMRQKDVKRFVSLLLKRLKMAFVERR